MEELRVCLNCRHEKGFNVFFKKSKDGKGKVKICLVCPHCGQSMDIGWTSSTIKSFKSEKGIIY